jgi:hypothetical protein
MAAEVIWRKECLCCVGKLPGPRYEFSALFHCFGCDLAQPYCVTDTFPHPYHFSTHLNLIATLKREAARFAETAERNLLAYIPVVPKVRSAGPSRDQFSGDPCIHFCIGDCEVFLFYNGWNNVSLKIMAKRL